MPATVVILTKLPGHLPVKTRLWPKLGEAGARDFYLEMLRDTVELARRIDPRPTIAYSPPDADPDLPIQDCRLLSVEGDNGATCLENALSDAYDQKPLIALGGDAPDLPEDRLKAVLEGLTDHDAVFVPTPDGGFSCLGLRRPHAGLAMGFTYGSGDALTCLRRFFESKGLRTLSLEPWRDIDTPEDLAGL